jgi:hypothetical protein
MINFDTDLDLAYEAKKIKLTTTVAPVRERLTVRPAPARHVPPPPADQGWEDLRDYVMGQIAEAQPWSARDSRRENTVFMGFHGRWQALALPIARHAFEDGETPGFWMGAPIGVFRFEPTSDNCFAKVIAARL